MTHNPHNLTVGQKLWFVPERNYHGAPREVTVEKIGRVWATVNNAPRVSLNTLMVDGGGYDSPGRCHLSRDVWEAERKRQIAWSPLRRKIMEQYDAPKDFDPISVDAIAKLLGICIEGVECSEKKP